MFDKDQNNDPVSNGLNEKELFFSALEIENPEERSIWLKKACGKNEDLYERLEGLLAAEATEGMDFLSPNEGRLEEVVAEMGQELQTEITPLEADQNLSEQIGDTIGRYKLLQKLGEGGGGVVYLSQQTEPVKRRVALKIIKLGMDTRDVVARFEAERQALAMMDHPNIAKVFDAGATESGRPYFVMELVKGVPITTFSDENKLGTRERLELFMQVCAAVQHAHQKGIIHRDLKPGNVLVTMMEDRPVPKVIDFGIAKATQQELTDKTLFTQHGQFIGTPVYMSPEQASMTGYDIDTRSDIYSLGVLLYELLAGAPPFDQKSLLSAGYNEMRRIIAEDEPPKPSTRCTETQANTARTIGSKPKKFHLNPSSLKGELDWVVMKAIEKNRTRRYETANAFAADIGRYLSNEPVQAAAPSASYKFRKFARRNKLVLSAGLAVALALISGIMVSTWQTLRAQAANKKLIIERNEKTELATRNGILAEQNRERSNELAAILSKTRIALAEKQRLAGNIGNAEKLLESCPAEHRQWEWHFVKALSTSKAKTYRDRTPDDEGLVFSPNGNWLAYPKAIGIVLRSTDGRKEQRYLEVPDGGSIEALKFNHDGTQLACVTNEGFTGHLWLWDLPGGALVHDLKGGSGGPFDLAFSPDGYEITMLSRQSYHTWNTRNGKLLRTIEDDSREMRGLAITADGSQLISSAGPKTDFRSSRSFQDLALREIILRDASTGKVNRSFKLDISVVLAIAFSPDRSRIATNSHGNVISVWNVEEGKIEQSLRGHQQAVDALCFSRDGRQLISGGRDKIVRLWDLKSGSEIRTLRGHEAPVSAVAMLSESETIASISRDSEVKMWEGRSSGAERDGLNLEDPNAVVSENGERAMSIAPGEGGVGKMFRLWEPARPDDSEVVLALPSKDLPGDVLRFALSSDGRKLALSVMEKADESREEPPFSMIYLCDAATGKLLHRLKANFDENITGKKLRIDKIFTMRMPYTVLEFSPDSKLFAVSFLSHVFVWEVSSGEIVKAIPMPMLSPTTLTWFPGESNERLMCGCFDGSLRVIDLSNGKELVKMMDGGGPVTAVAFCPDTRMIASASKDSLIRLWSADEGKLLHTMSGHVAAIHHMEFSAPSGRRLASVSRGQSLRFWDTFSGEEIVSFATKQIKMKDLRLAREAAIQANSIEKNHSND